MSVFQNSFLAGRTGFGSGGRYSQPRARGGMMTKDQYGDAVRKAIPQPMTQPSVARSQYQPQSNPQAFSAYSQQMAPARQDQQPIPPQGPYQQQPQQPVSQPQVMQSRSAPGIVGSQSRGEGRTMSNEDYSKKIASFGPQDGTPMTPEQIWEMSQWSQKNARAMI